MSRSFSWEQVPTLSPVASLLQTSFDAHRLHAFRVWRSHGLG